MNIFKLASQFKVKLYKYSENTNGLYGIQYRSPQSIKLKTSNNLPITNVTTPFIRGKNDNDNIAYWGSQSLNGPSSWHKSNSGIKVLIDYPNIGDVSVEKSKSIYTDPRGDTVVYYKGESSDVEEDKLKEKTLQQKDNDVKNILLNTIQSYSAVEFIQDSIEDFIINELGEVYRGGYLTVNIETKKDGTIQNIDANISDAPGGPGNLNEESAIEFQDFIAEMFNFIKPDFMSKLEKKNLSKQQLIPWFYNLEL